MMASGGRSTLPNYRAFLVRYTAASNLEENEVSGRVEHVESGQSAHFSSQQQLDHFIADMLRREEARRNREESET